MPFLWSIFQNIYQERRRAGDGSIETHSLKSSTMDGPVNRLKQFPHYPALSHFITVLLSPPMIPAGILRTGTEFGRIFAN